jgi:hypothetical protein
VFDTIKPIDRRCDTMMLFKTPWGSEQAVIIESQMQKDDGKIAAWAHYIFALLETWVDQSFEVTTAEELFD